jgi:hypothetical protein
LALRAGGFLLLGKVADGKAAPACRARLTLQSLHERVGAEPGDPFARRELPLMRGRDLFSKLDLMLVARRSVGSASPRITGRT